MNIVYHLSERTNEIQILISKKILSAVPCLGGVLVARYGVNKTTLKKISKKLEKENNA